MGVKNRYDGIDRYAVRLIKFKAIQLVGHAGFTDSDREDIEQEMVIDLLSRLPKFDPDKAKRNTFITRVVEHKVANLIEAQAKAHGDYRQYGCSLNEQVELDDGESAERTEIVSEDDYLQRTKRKSSPAQKMTELAIDLDVFLAKLPEELRSLCALLAEETLTEISDRTRVPRSTLYESINQLRRLLKKAGFDKYF
jgi:RNA polymerase sigma-70 factor (ECF subfamily)